MLYNRRHSTSHTTDRQHLQVDAQAECQITRYLPMIKAMASPYLKHLPAPLELDDLVSVGMCGLLEAMERFDASRNVPFEAYAKNRIRGAIIDEIRRMSWVSRRTLESIGLVKKTEWKLEQRHGQPATTHQVASHLGKAVPWVDTIKQHSQKITFQRLSGQGDSVDDAAESSASLDLTPQELYEMKEESRAARKAMNALPPSQSKILFQFYFTGLPMKTIGENLGLTESRISQIHSSAIKQLRTTYWTTPLRTSWGNVA